MKRQIIKIDEEKCNGCKLCIPNCPEGAIQVIDGKARLISDLFCDGLGACIGHCPEGAIKIEEREAEPYDEGKVMENIVKQGQNVICAHLEHLKEHGEEDYYKEAIEFLKEKGIENPLEKKGEKKEVKNNFKGCPGSRVIDLRDEKDEGEVGRQKSELNQWPIQFHLIPPRAPYFDNANLLIAADCVPFAYPNFHSDFLKDKIVIIGCPKLDDAGFYHEKLTEIIKFNNLNSITVVIMEVPCCYGLQAICEEAIKNSGKVIPLKQAIITISGEIQ